MKYVILKKKIKERNSIIVGVIIKATLMKTLWHHGKINLDMSRWEEFRNASTNLIRETLLHTIFINSRLFRFTIIRNMRIFFSSIPTTLDMHTL